MWSQPVLDLTASEQFGAIHVELSKREDSLQTLRNHKKMTLPKFVQRIIAKEVLTPKRRRRLHIPTRKWYGYLGRKVLKSGNPTQCGKIPQEEKNTAVIFMEQRTNQNNKMARKQNMISAVLLGASFVVILFKTKDTKFYVLQESSFLHPTKVR